MKVLLLLLLLLLRPSSAAMAMCRWYSSQLNVNSLRLQWQRKVTLTVHAGQAPGWHSPMLQVCLHNAGRGSLHRWPQTPQAGEAAESGPSLAWQGFTHTCLPQGSAPPQAPTSHRHSDGALQGRVLSL